MAEFRPYGKTPRLNRDIIITEKIDGTNAGIHVEELVPFDTSVDWTDERGVTHVSWCDNAVRVSAQSRNRLIFPGKTTDNAGFAGWVEENKRALAELLGKGLHFGEWFGPGVQGHGYGRDAKAFALFNPDRYDANALMDAQDAGVNIETVPVLYDGPFLQDAIEEAVSFLRRRGSQVWGAQGLEAEGVIVFHTASRQVYKVLCKNDDLPKSLAAVA